jgi:hypothetical protein
MLLFCRSELAREEHQDTAFNQTTRIIVDDFREQARSYKGLSLQPTTRL